MQKAGLYIHIPFCISKCTYCDFYSVADQNELIPQFVKALIREIENCEIKSKDLEFDTLFFGGGTPSLLMAEAYEMIFQALGKKFDLSALIEISLEANPGEAPESKLKEYLELGINRLSIGVQSLNEKTLKFLTRIHSTENAIDTFKSARKVGFKNINCDLINSIPGQSINAWKSDLEEILKLAPEHISAYSLTIEKGTALHSDYKNDLFQPTSDSLSAEMYLMNQDVLGSNGYLQYEISNFAKKGYECEHNNHYWRIDPYLGFGPSAHSYAGRIRWNNINNLNKYIAMSNTGQSLVIKRQKLSDKDTNNEIVGFGLRMVSGFSINQLSNNYRTKFIQKVESIKSKWGNKIILDGDRVKLSKSGLLFADAVAVDLMH